MMKKYAIVIGLCVCFCCLTIVNYLHGQESDLSDMDPIIQVANLHREWISTPTPVLIATGMGPTPSPTPVPNPSFSGCMHDCLAANYPPEEFPLFETCFGLEAQLGILVAAALLCAPSLPLPPSFAGCVGENYAVGIAVCMGVEVLPFTITATGCAWNCL